MMKRVQTIWVVLLLLASLSAASACRRKVDAPLAGLPSQSSPAPVRAEIGGKSRIGFASRERLREHFEKHGAEFGVRTAAEYLSQAQALRDQDVNKAGGELLEAARREGVITRYDRRTGAFLAFDADLTIRTFFKPNEGERYFQRQRRR